MPLNDVPLKTNYTRKKFFNLSPSFFKKVSYNGKEKILNWQFLGNSVFLKQNWNWNIPFWKKKFNTTYPDSYIRTDIHSVILLKHYAEMLMYWTESAAYNCAECNSVECSSAECSSDECHSDECCSDECHSDECHSD